MSRWTVAALTMLLPTAAIADGCEGLLAGLQDRAVIESSRDASSVVTDILCEKSTKSWSQAKSRSGKLGVVIFDVPIEFGASSSRSNFNSFQQEMCRDNSTRAAFSDQYKGSFSFANYGIAKTFLECKGRPGLHVAYAPTDDRGTFDVRAAYRPVGIEVPNLLRVDHDESAVRIRNLSNRIGKPIPSGGIAIEVERLHDRGDLLTFVMDNAVEGDVRIPSEAGNEDLLERITALEERLPSNASDVGVGRFQSLDVDLGTLPLSPGTDQAYVIPNTVPSTASQILVFAFVSIGNLAPAHGKGPFYYEFSTSDGGVVVGRHFLGGFGGLTGAHSDFTGNANTFWLPVGSDRTIIVRLRRDRPIPRIHGDNKTIIQYTGLQLIGWQ